MKNKKTSESSVLRGVIQKLNFMQLTKEVVWYTRLNSGNFKVGIDGWVRGCAAGTPDIVVCIRHDLGARLLFLEVKGSRGKLRYEQQKFFKRMEGIRGVYCEMINDPSQLFDIIKKIREEVYV